MSDVFISYSRKDIAFARLIREALQESHVDTWIDWDRIPIGERWWQEICEAIQNANVFMFIISHNSIGSNVCKEEIGQAIQNHKRIIPIVVDELKPEAIREFIPELPQYNWIIFERDQIFRLEENPIAESDKPEDRQVALPKFPQFEKALEKLSVAIHTDWAWVKYHTQLQNDALRWENAQKNPSFLIRGAELEQAERALIQSTSKDPQPTSLQADYITESRKEENLQEKKARQRQRLVLWAVGTGLVVAVVLGLVAWSQRNEAVSQSNIRATAEANAVMEANNRATAEANAIDEANARATAQVRAEIASTQAVQQRDEAEHQAAMAISSSLAAQSRNYLDTQYDLALLLAVEGVRVSDTYAARDGLLNALQRRPRLDAFLRTTGVLTHMIFSPDGSLLAGAYCAELDTKRNCLEYQMQLWDMTNRQPAGEPVSGVKGPLLFTGNGEKLIVRRGEGQFALMDIETRQVTDIPISNSSYAPNLAVNPDQTLMAAADCSSMSFPSGLCGGAYLLVWDFENGELVYQTDETNAYYPGSLAFSPDGTMLAWSGCAEVKEDENGIKSCMRGDVLTWDVQSGKVSRHLSDEDTAVVSLAFRPDGKVLAAGNNKGNIIFYDTDSWQETGRRLKNDGVAKGLIYSLDGQSLVSSVFGKPTSTWDLKTAQLSGQLSVGTNFFSHEVVVADPQGNMLADSGCYKYDNTGFLCEQSVVLLWDTSNHPPLGHVFVQVNAADWRNSEFLSPDGSRLALAECIKTEKINDLNNKCVEGQITTVDTTTGLPVGPVIDGLPSEIFAAVFSSTNDRLASVSCSKRENLLCLQSRIDWWDVGTGQPVNDPVFYDWWILHILLGPDDQTLYFDGQGNTIEWLNLEMDQPAGEPLQGFTLNEMTFSHDGKILASGGCVEYTQNCKKSEIYFFDTQTWELVGDPISLAAGEMDVSYMDVRSLKFSPDDRSIAIATQGGIRFWDMQEHSFLELIIPETNVFSMAFSHSGKILAVNGRKSNAGYLDLWDLEKGQPIGLSYQVNSADSNQFVFNQDDTLLISNDGIAWDVNPISWQARACRVANRNFTEAEWKVFLGEKPYHKTCPDLP